MLTLPAIFEQDINSRITNIHPLIVIGWDVVTQSATNDAIWISQIKESITYNGQIKHCKDVDLKISSIKENINIESKNFNINNVNLSLSNYGSLSDELSGYDIMNKNVAIFWKSQSAKELDDCLLVYIASIRRYDHDDKIIRIQLEDNTQDKISKDVPIANLGVYGDRVYSDKYKNKYIPIAYGYIPYAPAIIWPRTQEESPDSSDSGYWILGDDIRDSLQTGRGIMGYVASNYHSCIYRGRYWRVRPTRTWDIDEVFDGTSTEQVELSDFSRSIFVRKRWNGDEPANPSAANFINCKDYPTPSQVHIKNEDGRSVFGNDRPGQIYIGTADNEDGTVGMEVKNPNYASDFGATHQTLESKIFGLSWQETHLRFPDNDLTEIPDAEIPPIEDFSNDLPSDFFDNAMGGNFLEFSPVEMTHFKFNPVHWKWQDVGDMSVANRPPTPNGMYFENGGSIGSYDAEWYQQRIIKMGYVFDGSAYVSGYSLLKKDEGEHDHPVTGPNLSDYARPYFGEYGMMNFEGNSSYSARATWKNLPMVNSLKYGYLDEFGCVLVQVPTIEHIRNLVNEHLAGLGQGSVDGGHIEILDPFFASGEYPVNGDFHEYYQGRVYAYQHVLETATYSSGGFTSPGLQYPQTIGINSATPYGTTAWIFNRGYNTFGGADWPNNFVIVTMDGRFDVDYWKIEQNSVSYEDQQNIHSVLSLMELVDFSQGCVYVPHTYLGAQYVADGKKFEYNVAWNGIAPNQGIFGEEAAGHPTLGEYTSAYRGGGRDRFFCLYTKNGLLEEPGALQSMFATGPNQVMANSYNEVYGGSFSAHLPLIEQNEYVAINTYDSSSDDGRRIGIRFEFPTIGSDGQISGAVRTATSYDFRIGIDPAQLEELSGATGNDLVVYMRATDEEGNYSTTSDIIINFEDIPDRLNDQGELVFSNLSWTMDEFSGTIEDGGLVNQFEDAYFEQNSQFEGAGNDYWYDVNRYKQLTLHITTATGDTTRYNLNVFVKVLVLTLNIAADFDDLDDSDFYIRDYYGRGGNEPGLALENPAEVIVDILNSELEYDGDIDLEDINKAVSATSGWELGFSVTDKINSKTLIEDICTNTPLFPRLRGKNSFGFSAIKNYYEPSEVDRIIDPRDVIKHKFTRTKLDEVKSLVEVKYDLDYATDEFRQSSGWVSCKDYFGDGDLGYVGENGPGYRLKHFGLGTERELSGINLVTDSESTLTFEAKYITEFETASKLAEFLVLWYCNQHTIITADLSMHYIDIEVGDTVKFSSLISNSKAYGEDYSQFGVYRNGQHIFNKFMVTSVTRGTNKITMECIQLHELRPSFVASLGDISRRGTAAGTDNPPDTLDYEMLLEYIQDKETTRYTREQIKSMDVNQSNGITSRDADYWDLFLENGATI